MQPFRWGGTPFADGRFPTADGRARLVRSCRGRSRTASRLADDAQHRALSRSLAHDDPHRLAQAGAASRGTAGRGPSRRCRGLALADGGLARVGTPQGESLYRVSGRRQPAAGELFVPIPLDRSHGDRRPHRPVAATADRSAFGPAGLQGQPRCIARSRPAGAGFLILAGEARIVPTACGRPESRCRQHAVGAGRRRRRRRARPAAAARRADRGGRCRARHATRRDPVRRPAGRGAVRHRGGQLPTRDWLVAQLSEAQAAPTLLAGGHRARPSIAARCCASVSTWA